jgi:hypothetical protein
MPENKYILTYMYYTEDIKYRFDKDL